MNLTPLITLAELAESTVRRQDVRGCYGCATGLLVSQLLVRESARLQVVLVENATSALRLEQDLQALTPTAKARYLPPPGESPYEQVRPERAASQARAAVLSELHTSGERPNVLIVCAESWIRKVPEPDAVIAKLLQFSVGDSLDLKGLAAQLDAAGYQRCPLVEDPATFTLRGDIIDIWPPSAHCPLRIELEFEKIQQISYFDSESQRKQKRESLLSCVVGPAKESACSQGTAVHTEALLRKICDDIALPSVKTRALVGDVLAGRMYVGETAYLPALCTLVPVSAHLPNDARVLVENPIAFVSAALRHHEHLHELYEARATNQPAFLPEAHACSLVELDQIAEARSTILLHRSAVHGGATQGLRGWAVASDDCPDLATADQLLLSEELKLARHGGADLSPLIAHITDWIAQERRVIITTRTSTQAERVLTLLHHRGLSCKVGPLLPFVKQARAQLTIAVAQLSQGIVAETENLVLITEEEIFGRRKQAAAQSKKAKFFDALGDLRHLSVGDYVVHIEHGIGKYQGLFHQVVGSSKIDVLAIEYAGGDRLLLPVYRLNQVQKYDGDQEKKLDRLGGQTFSKTKSRVKKRVRDIADQLLRTYSARHERKRPPLPSPGDDYLAFEAGFPFEETPDQAAAILDVISDLKRDTVMDRLVCGDVGFGKTEVALRAAYLSAMEGRQVALLCPTTVLADQHYLTFSRRLEGTGLQVRALSRFESKKSIDSTLYGLKLGNVDIVIGTHRLLSKDVFFKNLGLLVIDEEQRFGVTHKERLKELRAQIDVLTLSATPIPRTLNLAVGGLLDMSVILTPPEKRRAIRTLVARFDETLICQAINKEIARGGQVFYVYNRIEGLFERASQLRELIPALKVGVIHGQMSERELETQMHSFVAGEFDVLCSTAIVESGLDIPRANTILIDRADLFGLSQLYQLRGRVGRSSERAYCYLLIPGEEKLSNEAQKRIETLEAYSELGSGFQVASMDMAIRGTGDVLGAEQTGFTSQVGFELFAQMLAQATSELQGLDYVPDVDPELSLDIEAYLPDSYVDDIGVRLSLYKRFSCAESVERIVELDEEMLDRFGPPPQQAQTFSQMMHLKTRLRNLRALGLQATKNSVHLHLRADTPLTTERLVELVSLHDRTYSLSPDGRLSRRAQTNESFTSGLAHAEHMLLEMDAP